MTIRYLIQILKLESGTEARSEKQKFGCPTCFYLISTHQTEKGQGLYCLSPPDLKAVTAGILQAVERDV